MKKYSFLFIIFITFLFYSCATKVKYDVERPAKLDMNGANTIAVLKFMPLKCSQHGPNKPPRRGEKYNFNPIDNKNVNLSNDERKIIDYIDFKLNNSLANSKYLKSIDPSTILDPKKYKNLSDIVDVYLTGEIIKFDIWDEKQETVKKVPLKENKDPPPKDEKKPIPNDDKKNPEKEYEIITEIKFKRHVNFEFFYQIIDTTDDSIISYNKVEIRNESSLHSNPNHLPDSLTIIETTLNSKLKDIIHDIQPYTIQKSILLLDDKNYSTEIKEASNLAKNGYFSEASNEFINLYNQTGLFVAGYNAALTYEAMGDYNTSLKIMNDLYLRTGDKRAKKSLSDIQNEIYLNNKLEQQMEAKELRN